MSILTTPKVLVISNIRLMFCLVVLLSDNHDSNQGEACPEDLVLLDFGFEEDKGEDENNNNGALSSSSRLSQG